MTNTLFVSRNLEFAAGFKEYLDNSGNSSFIFTEFSNIAASMARRQIGVIVLYDLNLTQEIMIGLENLRNHYNPVELRIIFLYTNKPDLSFTKFHVLAGQIANDEKSSSDRTVQFDRILQLAKKWAPLDFSISEIRKMIHHSISPDKDLAKEPGLPKLDLKKVDCFKIKHGEEFFIAAKSITFTHKLIDLADVAVMAKSCTFFRKHDKTWYKVWPTKWVIDKLNPPSISPKKPALSDDVTQLLNSIEEELLK